jgi:hypothetical protein
MQISSLLRYPSSQSADLEAQKPRTSISKKSLILKKIWNAVQTIFKIGIAVFLYTMNPSIFVAGTIFGVIVSVVWPDKVNNIIERIKLIFIKLPWHGLAVIGIGAFFALPVIVGAGSLLGGAYVGCILSQWAQERENKTNPPLPLPAT